MGLLAQKRMLFVLIFLGMGSWARADDLFHLTMVDYFGMKSIRKERDVGSTAWEEPGYHPPQVVVDLLNDPNEETALQYLRWHRDRLDKISRAQEAVEKVKGSISGARP